MPNINDINGVTVANLAKLDAVLKANISKVNGLTLAAAFTGLLDTYTGAAAAYSTRKLKTGVTVAARIRRSGDDIEADVEFDSNNEISLTSPISNASSGTYTDLADFVDHSTTPRDAFVDEWKDQSGSGNHAAQATAGNQPKLYDATTGLVTENGKPAAQFTGSQYLRTSQLSTVAQPTTRILVCSIDIDSSDSSKGYVCDGHTLRQVIGIRPDSNVWRLYSGTISDYTTTATTGQQTLLTARFDDTASTYSELFIDGTAQGSKDVGNQGFDGVTIGAQAGTPSVFHDGNIQEIIVYPNDQTQSPTNNRTGIETNVNSEYLIYQPTDAPTSGLLATYTGAAAAYSVRQLSDKAVIAMRIRRDSDDEERNIGWDANGDLDTTAISAFCGTANGYVVEWADQSTNGNHATQSTVAFQPLIYNGTAVITINGKPGIQHSQSSSHGFVSGSNIGISGTGDRTNFIVAECDNISGNTESTVMSYGGGGAGEAWQNTFEPWIRVGSGYQSFSGTTANTQHLLTTALWSGTNVTDSSMFIDGSAATAGAAASRTLNTTNSTVVIGGGTSGTGLFSGTVQEILIWASDESSNRTGIETNINGYFSIF